MGLEAAIKFSSGDLRECSRNCGASIRLPPLELRSQRIFTLIERHYGSLIEGAQAGIIGRLDALEAQLEPDAETEVSQ